MYSKNRLGMKKNFSSSPFTSCPTQKINLILIWKMCSFKTFTYFINFNKTKKLKMQKVITSNLADICAESLPTKYINNNKSKEKEKTMEHCRKSHSNLG